MLGGGGGKGSVHVLIGHEAAIFLGLICMRDHSSSMCSSDGAYMYTDVRRRPQQKSPRRTAPFLRNPRNNRPTTSQSVIITYITS